MLGLPEDEQSNAYKWEAITGDGIILKNVHTGNVIRHNGTSLVMSAQLSSTDANYKQTVWYIIDERRFVPMTDFELNDDWLLPNTTKTFKVESDASWSSNDCFTWSIRSLSSQTVFTVTNEGRITASQNGGIATLTLTHKMTGLTKTFAIKSGELRDGTYMIMNKGTSRYMEVESASMASGGVVQQWQYHTGAQAKWVLTLNSAGYYTIKSLRSGLYLYAGSTTDSTAIIQYISDAGGNGKWNITKTSAGNYKLSPYSSSAYAISVPLNENANGTNLVKLSYTNDSNYRDEWMFDTVGELSAISLDKTYHIQSLLSDKVLEVADGSTVDGANIIQQTADETKTYQSWRFIYVGDGNYLIQDVHSGKYVSVDTSTGGVSNIRLWSYDNADSEQYFKIKRNTDGTYTFYAQCSYSSVMEVQNSSRLDGANIRQSYYTGADNQKFYLIPSSVECQTIVVPCLIGSSPSHGLQSFETYLSYYLEPYAYLLNGVEWRVYENGVMTFDETSMTVKGTAVGLGWLEAYDQTGRLVFICHVYVDNILKNLPSQAREYLYSNGTYLASISNDLFYGNDFDESIPVYEEFYHRMDPLLLRTEWFLYAIQLTEEGLREEEVQTRLEQKFGIYAEDEEAFRLLYSEVQVGALGGYTRENLKLSFDGLHFLLNFYWAQWAQYSIATLDRVNIYTPATEQDVLIEKQYAQKLCGESRQIVQGAQNAQISGGYNADNFQSVLLKKGTKIYRLCYDSSNLASGRWYTSEKSFLKSGRDYESIYSGLQVSTSGTSGQRYKIAEYILKDDVYVAYGIVERNTIYGVGGYEQYFINTSNWESLIGTPTNIYDLINVPTN